MNIDSGDTPLVLLCPAWKRWGTATTVKPNTVILHSPADETIPFADSQEPLHNSGLAESALIVVGTDLQLADPEPLKAMLEAVERVSQTKTTDSPLPTKPAPNRITRWLLIAVGIYSFLLVSFLNLVILNSDKARDRAIFLMADGMILLWIIVGGSLTPMLRRWLVPRIATIPIDWRVRFVLFCTAMALIEEVITTTMTNLASVFGSTPEEAHITGIRSAASPGRYQLLANAAPFARSRELAEVPAPGTKAAGIQEHWEDAIPWGPNRLGISSTMAAVLSSCRSRASSSRSASRDSMSLAARSSRMVFSASLPPTGISSTYSSSDNTCVRRVFRNAWYSSTRPFRATDCLWRTS
jgi:hypothetical protein